MRVVIQYVSWVVGLPLELLIIGTLIRGPYRRYPLLLVYTIALFLATVVEIPANLAFFSGVRLSHSRAFYYWINEGILQALIFAVVISLVYQATAELRTRGLVRTALIGLATLFAVGSFWIHYDPRVVVGTWMTQWTRDLNFTSAVLDLALWAILLASRKRDPRLLLLSGGLGIQFTGEAVGESIRQMFPLSLSPGDVLIVMADLACLWIWWQALRTAVAPNRASVPAPGRE
jgi:hypothetical protein